MLAEAYIENNEMRVVNFPKDAFNGKHWRINIEPIEEIKDEEVLGIFDEFVGILDNDFLVNDIKYKEIVK